MRASRSRPDSSAAAASWSERSGSVMSAGVAWRLGNYSLAMAIIESIPNVSEGRRQDVIARLVEALRGTPGVRLLDHSSDASHNRSVFTLAGDAPALKAAILA